VTKSGNSILAILKKQKHKQQNSFKIKLHAVLSYLVQINRQP
jgi:hypothetical protein